MVEANPPWVGEKGLMERKHEQKGKKHKRKRSTLNKILGGEKGGRQEIEGREKGTPKRTELLNREKSRRTGKSEKERLSEETWRDMVQYEFAEGKSLKLGALLENRVKHEEDPFRGGKGKGSPMKKRRG